MEEEPDQKTIAIIVCKDSSFADVETYKDMEFQVNIFKLSGIDKLREDILEVLELDERHHVVRLHLQIGCNAVALWNVHIWLDTHPDVEQDVNNRSRIYACIQRREIPVSKPTDMSKLANRAGDELDEMLRKSRSRGGSRHSSYSQARYQASSRDHPMRSIEQSEHVTTEDVDDDQSRRTLNRSSAVKDLGSASSFRRVSCIVEHGPSQPVPPSSLDEGRYESADSTFEDGDVILPSTPRSSSMAEDEADQIVDDCEETQDGGQEQRRPSKSHRASSQPSRKSSKAIPKKSKKSGEEANDLTEDATDVQRAKSEKKPAKDRIGEDFEFIRIGKKHKEQTPPGRATDDKAIAMSEVIVAKVPKPAYNGKDGKRVPPEFVSVNAWTINGLEIGRIETANKLDIDINDHRLWLPDSGFKDKNKKAIEQIVECIVDGKLSVTYDELPASGSSAIVRLKHAPRVPLCAEREKSLPTNLSWPDQIHGEAHCVVYFHNLMWGKSSLRLETNLQSTLDLDETYESFKEWMLDGDREPPPAGQDAWDGLRPHPKMQNFDNDYQVEIWVLPQIEGSEEMYCWTTHKNLLGRDFLDGAVALKHHGYAMYIEVHLLSNDNRSGNKGDVVKRPSRLNGGEGGGSDSTSKSKGTGKKRGREDEDENEAAGRKQANGKKSRRSSSKT